MQPEIRNILIRSNLAFALLLVVWFFLSPPWHQAGDDMTLFGLSIGLVITLNVLLFGLSRVMPR